MPVQRNHCFWPTCYQQTALGGLIGLDGDIHLVCPFHRSLTLSEMGKREGAHMPVVERTEPSGPFDTLALPFTAWCEVEGCWWRVAAPSYEEGVRLYTTHKCPYSKPSRGFLVALTTVQKCWIKLDAAVAELLEGNWPDTDGSPHPERIRLKGVCRGMAEVIAELMGPGWTGDTVSAEAATRYKKKKAGEDYETPGLVPTLAKPPTVAQKDAMNKSRPAPAPVVTHKFKPEEVKAIRMANEMGMMSVAELAKMYKVQESVIQKVIEEEEEAA